MRNCLKNSGDAVLVIYSPDGEQIELKSNSLFVVAELLHKMSQP